MNPPINDTCPQCGAPIHMHRSKVIDHTRSSSRMTVLRQVSMRGRIHDIKPSVIIPAGSYARATWHPETEARGAFVTAEVIKLEKRKPLPIPS